MALAGLLQQSAIIPAMRANSKKQLLQELAVKAAKITGLPEREIFDVILQRERLGSTGVGNGIAIPHGKLSGINRLYGLFARLETAIDFDAIDEQPVDCGDQDGTLPECEQPCITPTTAPSATPRPTPNP